VDTVTPQCGGGVVAPRPAERIMSDDRSSIVAAGIRMREAGLGTGTAGNISVRTADGMLITPSALPWLEFDVENIVAIDMNGRLQEPHTRVRPSSEWRLHAAVLTARPDAVAVVHAHPTHATALACLRRNIPAFHYLVALAGGDDIPCTAWAPPGSDALAGLAADALARRDACLLANHGMVAIGPDLASAFALAVEIETLARQYCVALQAGEPVLLTAAEIGGLIAEMGRYRRHSGG
jgi:L-fuculose-phosphate aldolase